MGLAGAFSGYRSRGYGTDTGRVGRLEKVTVANFCETRGCTKLAEWRIGYENQTADLCSRHAVTIMRSQRLWNGLM